MVDPLACFDCYGTAIFDNASLVVALFAGLALRRWFHSIPATVAIAIAAQITAIVSLAIFFNGEATWLWRAYPIGHPSFWWERLTLLAVILAVILAVYAIRRLIAHAVRGGIGRVLAYVATAIAIVGGGVLAVDRFGAIGPEPVALPAGFLDVVRRVEGQPSSRCFVDPAARIDVPLITPEAGGIASTNAPRALPAEYAAAPLLGADAGGDRESGSLLTPIEGIRTPNFATYPSDNFLVALMAVVGTKGEVLAAVPLDGPPDAYPAAVRIAMRWRFVPYLRDGKPTIVRLEYFFVPTGPPERPPGRQAPFPEVRDKTAVRIHLVQQFPYDRDAGYAVTIRGDGAVRFEGQKHVALLGEHCATIAPEAVDRLIDAFRAADFYALDDAYVAESIRKPAVAVSITIDGRTKTVVDYNGFYAGMPNAVFHLQNLIDDTAGVQRWTRGNALTGPSLVAEKWNFSRSDDANRLMILGVARYGDVQAVRDLLRLGAPARSDGWEPLEAAATRGDFDMVRALLDSTTQWTQEELTEGLIAIADFGSDELVRAFVRRGADVNAQGSALQSVLALAAQAGVPGPVATLVQAGADVKAIDPWGQTALHKTQPDNPERSLESALADRGAVVEMLVRAGIPVDARDEWQRTPLIGNRRGHEGVAAALIAHGADVNAQDSEGHTPLMTNDNPQVTEMLLAAGANPFLTDLKGRTILDSRDELYEPNKRSAVLATINSWIAAHPADAKRAREEATRIGKTRIPRRVKPPEAADPRITPIDHIAPFPIDVPIVNFLLIVLVQMCVAYGLFALARAGLQVR